MAELSLSGCLQLVTIFWSQPFCKYQGLTGDLIARQEAPRIFLIINNLKLKKLLSPAPKAPPTQRLTRESSVQSSFVPPA